MLYCIICLPDNVVSKMLAGLKRFLCCGCRSRSSRICFLITHSQYTYSDDWTLDCVLLVVGWTEKQTTSLARVSTALHHHRFSRQVAGSPCRCLLVLVSLPCYYYKTTNNKQNKDHQQPTQQRKQSRSSIKVCLF